MLTKNIPLISVIIPVYNTGKYLNRCLDSVLGQSYEKLEVILVDDGSTDNSIEICKEYEKKDKRIRVLHKENEGQASARNLGLDVATGEYIGFVDSDDEIDKSMYETLYLELIKNNADIALCGRYIVSESGNKVASFCFENVKIWDKKEATRRFLLWKGIDASSCDKLFDKKVLEGIRYPSGYIGEDISFVFSAIANSQKIVHTGTAFYYYYQRSGSTSHSKYSERTKGALIYQKDVYEKVKKEFPDLSKEGFHYYFKGLLYVASSYRKANETKAEDWMLEEIKYGLSLAKDNPYIKKKDYYALSAMKRQKSAKMWFGMRDVLNGLLRRLK